MVTKAPRFSCTVPILKQLHWLPVTFRINFKTCTVHFRTLKDNQLAYLADLLLKISTLQFQIDLLVII